MTVATRYVVDTTVLIDSSKGRDPARSWLSGVVRSAAEVGVSTVTNAEFFSGTPPPERGRAERLFAELTEWPVTAEIATRAGSYRYAFARQGRTISTPDALIAATAASIGATLVTSNVKDFPMPDLGILRIGP